MISMFKPYIILFFLFILCSCQPSNDQSCKEYYNIPHYNVEEIVPNVEIHLDTISIDSSIEWSYAGEFWLRNDTLCLSDLYSGYIYRLTPDGSIIDRQVGFGKGPDEAIGFMYSIPVNQNYVLLSTDWMIYYFNTQGKKLNEVQFDWHITTHQQGSKILRKADPGDYLSYENDFGRPGVADMWNDREVAVGMTASLPKFNGYFNTERYYTYGRIIALIDIYTGKITRILGRRSPLYLEKKNLPNFDHSNFTVLPETFMVNFRIDPNIYVINKKDDKALYAFGMPGREMNTNWPLTLTYEEAENKLLDDEYVYGYYTYLKKDLEHDLTFRGYRKGSHATTDGLQVYKGKTLIADIDVPQGFRVIGKIGDSFYAQIMDESEIPCFYRFSLANIKL